MPKKSTEPAELFALADSSAMKKMASFKPVLQKKCEYCGAKHQRKRFCSNTCKDRFHNKNNPRGYGLINMFPLRDEGSAIEADDDYVPSDGE